MEDLLGSRGSIALRKFPTSNLQLPRSSLSGRRIPWELGVGNWELLAFRLVDVRALAEEHFRTLHERF